MAIAGIGIGAMMQVFVISIQNAVARARIGSATALGTFSRQIGATIGVTVMGVIVNHGLPSAAAAGEGAPIHRLPPALRGALAAAIKPAFLAATLVVARRLGDRGAVGEGGAAAALGRRRRRLRLPRAGAAVQPDRLSAASAAAARRGVTGSRKRRLAAASGCGSAASGARLSRAASAPASSSPSILASRSPGHWRTPPPKGKKANFGRVAGAAQRSGSKRSGSLVPAAVALDDVRARHDGRLRRELDPGDGRGRRHAAGDEPRRRVEPQRLLHRAGGERQRPAPVVGRLPLGGEPLAEPGVGGEQAAEPAEQARARVDGGEQDRERVLRRRASGRGRPCEASRPGRRLRAAPRRSARRASAGSRQLALRARARAAAGGTSVSASSPRRGDRRVRGEHVGEPPVQLGGRALVELRPEHRGAERRDRVAPHRRPELEPAAGHESTRSSAASRTAGRSASSRAGANAGWTRRRDCVCTVQSSLPIVPGPSRWSSCCDQPPQSTFSFVSDARLGHERVLDQVGMREHEQPLPPEPSQSRRPRRVPGRARRAGRAGTRACARGARARSSSASSSNRPAPVREPRGAHWRESRCDVPRRRRPAGRRAADGRPTGRGRCPTRRGRRRRRATTSSSPTGASGSTRSRACCRPTFPSTPTTGTPGSASCRSASRTSACAACRPCRGSPSSSSTSARTSRSTAGPACGCARSTSRTPCCSRPRSAPTGCRPTGRGCRRAATATSGRCEVDRDGLSFVAALPAGRRAVHRRARLARALPDRALLHLHGRRRTALPRRAAPRAVAAVRGRRHDRGEHARAGRARGRAARALRRGAGRARLAAGGALSPQRRTALVSVVAAAALVALKLTVGLASHSLGLVSEAIHSGTDLVAAPADVLRGRRRGPAGRPEPPVRPRQGRAPRRAGRGRVPRRGERLHRRARARAPGRLREAHGRRDVVGARGRRCS